MGSNNRYDGYDAYARRRRALRRRNGHYGHYAGRGGIETTKRAFPLWAMAVIGLFVLGAAVAAGAGAYAISTYNSYASELLAPDELAINQPSFGAVILDRNGNELYEYIDDKAGLRRPTPLAEISPAFLAATISTEDDTFFTNPGVNIQGLMRAAWENSPFGDTELFAGSGGSSITQQLVKNVYIPLEERMERSVDRKVKETIYALELTQRYEKSRILEWYVNQISYAGVFNGVEAASIGYFGKPATELTLGEAAMLAGIPQSPAAYNPLANLEASLARRDDVLDLMLRQSPIQIGENEFFEITEADVARAKAEVPELVETQFEMEAPHWVLSYIEPQLRVLLGCPTWSQMFQEMIDGKRDIPEDRPGYGCEPLFTQGLIIVTTLDLELQYQVEGILRGQIAKYEESSNTRNGSIMVMDPHTGEILVMVGSRDYYRDDIDGRNNNAIACNSPGSSFKPFAYLATFEQLGWGPGTLILDAPVTYTDSNGNVFQPSNPLKDFAGPISIRQALGNSLNIPANKAAAAVTAQGVVNQARKVGFVDTFRVDGCSNFGGYGPAIATGGVDVTLAEMVYGYSTLAAAGVMRGQEPISPHDDDERQVDPLSILKIVDNLGNVRWDAETKKRDIQVLDAGYAYLLWDILTDSNARCRTFGCGLNIPGYTVAVKTGTSEPYADNDPICGGKIGETWAFGYSPDLVVGVWAGNSDNSCVTNISSASLSFDAMSETFQLVHSGREITSFPRPSNVVETELCVPSGMLKSELCRVTTKDLSLQTDVPKEQDTWWQRVRIDIRNNKLATAATPPQYTLEKVMLVLPEGWIASTGDQNLTPEQKAERDRILEWANALKIEIAPTEQSDGRIIPGQGIDPLGGGLGGDIPAAGAAAILWPANGQQLLDQTQILGQASIPNFAQYRLEFGQGPNPQVWTNIITVPIARPAGVLGIWDPRALEPGMYTLRLVVTNRDGDEIATSVLVHVGN